MIGLLAAAGAPATRAPHIDWGSMSQIVALTAGACIVLLAGLLRSPWVRRHGVPILSIVTLAVTAGLGVWQWGENRIDRRRRAGDGRPHARAHRCSSAPAAIAAVLMSWRESAVTEAGEGEYFALMLLSVLGMVVLVAASNLVVLFVGFELLSIPLYVLCATRMRREHSLESGLKYLIIGSVGSATLLYGLALLYGAVGDTSLIVISQRVGALSNDTLLLTGVGLIVAGLAFKASVAPFHQWTPDVYEGAPTPITGFMAVATKAAAFGVLLRLFDVGLIDLAGTWGPAMAVLAAITIVVGNVGAIGQSSLKRMLAYSSVGQAGYMLAGVVVSTKLGVQAVVFYLAAYLLMNLAAFAVITIRERESDLGDDIASLYGTGASRPWLAWPMTIAMLSLAGFPLTMGFFGKLYLIEATVDNGYAWLGGLHRPRLGDLARVLPARDRGGLDALAERGRGPARGAHDRARRGAPPADGRRLDRGRRGGRGGRAAAARDADRAARGDRRRGGVRRRHGVLRDLPVAAVRRRARRRRGTDQPDLGLAPGGELRRRALSGACHRPASDPPAARPRSTTWGCSPSSPSRSRARGRRPGSRAEIPRAVVHAARTGICIAGGDVCRASDAAAAGLAPCLTGETARGSGAAVTVLSVHLGHSGSLTVAQRSDGSVLITKLSGEAAGLVGGVGVALGPLVNVGAEATFDLTLAHGQAWELPSPAAASALIAALRRGDDPPVAPTWRFGDAGEQVDAFVGASLPGVRLTALEASGGMAAGARVGHGRADDLRAPARRGVVAVRDAAARRSRRLGRSRRERGAAAARRHARR